MTMCCAPAAALEQMAKESKPFYGMKREEENYFRDDALRAEYIAISLILAFVFYNLLRTIANSFGTRWLHWTWAIMLILMVAIIHSLHNSIKKKTEKGGAKDWHADILIVGTLSRVLGLCIVGAMRKVNPGLRQNLQDWFGVSAIFGSVLEVLLVTFLVLLMIAIRSGLDDSEEDAYGFLSVVSEHRPSYPEEVVGFAIAMAVVWSVFLSGLLGDFVRFNDLLQYNVVWFHAVFCILLAGLLYIFWDRVILRKMMMNTKNQADLIGKECAVYDEIKELKPSV